MSAFVSPATATVTLSDGRKIMVGQVRFGAVVEVVESELFSRLLGAARSEGAVKVARRVLAALPPLVEIALRWSTEPNIDAADLPAADARTLLQAFLRVNPPAEMLAEVKQMIGTRHGAGDRSPGLPDASERLDALFDLVASEYGWTDEQILATPLLRLLRRIRLIRCRRVERRLQALTDSLWPWRAPNERQRVLAPLIEERLALAPRMASAEDYVADPALKKHIRHRQAEARGLAKGR